MIELKNNRIVNAAISASAPTEYLYRERAVT
jgi:hypothetical protein